MTSKIKLSAAAQLDAKREHYSRSFANFVAAAWSIVDPAPFKPNWHIKVLADELQAVAEGRNNRLLINVPPGTAKSLITNVMFPAWLWTRSPEKRVISASFSLSLATRDSRKCRTLITSDWYQQLWPLALKDDENRKIAFENEHRGAREAMPLTSMTGSRGNIVIIDDPHSVDSAKSAAERKRTCETFLEAVPSRLNDPETDAIIVIMQRLHQEDVAGAILERPELGYVHLCIPMLGDGIQRAPTASGWIDTREEGEPMFPSRFGPKWWAQTKGGMSPYVWSGQYQQNPVPSNDGFFVRDWFNRYDKADLPSVLNYYLTSDHAPGGKAKSDFNVFRVWGVDAQRNVWLVDSFRQQCTMDVAFGIERGQDGKIALAATGALPLIKKWNPRCWFPERDMAWISNEAMVKSAMRDVGILCRIEPLATRGSGDKIGKATAYQALASMGLVHLPNGSVGDEALLEYLQFPVGKHDDQVDADGAIARAMELAQPAFLPQVTTKPEYQLPDYEAEEVGSDADLYW